MLLSLSMVLHLLQEGPANTTSYMVGGYAVIFGVILLYLASLYVRNRNLKQDLEILRDLDERESQSEARPSGKKVVQRP